MAQALRPVTGGLHLANRPCSMDYHVLDFETEAYLFDQVSYFYSSLRL